jgi:hypothetical protein
MTEPRPPLPPVFGRCPERQVRRSASRCDRASSTLDPPVTRLGRQLSGDGAAVATVDRNADRNPSRLGSVQPCSVPQIHACKRPPDQTPQGPARAEKRKVGGSTPPLPTTTDQHKRPGHYSVPSVLTATLTATRLTPTVLPTDAWPPASRPAMHGRRSRAPHAEASQRPSPRTCDGGRGIGLADRRSLHGPCPRTGGGCLARSACRSWW